MNKQNVVPKTGGGTANVTPKKGGGTANTTPRRGAKSAPTEAPGVRAGVSIPANGSGDMPLSMKANPVDQIAPKRGGKDPAIERTA
jgi:hypothetical protein